MTNLNKAFRELRKKGYAAKQRFWCCSSCALAALPEGTEKFVFYHKQDAERLDRNRKCNLSWGGDGSEIVKVLNECGVSTDWNGTEQQRIKIDLN